MRSLLLTLAIICATSMSLGQTYDKMMEQIKMSKEYREKCPGGDMTKPVSSHYSRSHQQFDARPECIRSDFGVDVGAIPAVKMGEYMISDYSRHDYLLTGGVGPCVAITFYDPVTKTGMLAHLPPSAMFYSKNPTVQLQSAQDPHDKKFFDKILEAFDKKGIPRERLETNVYGNMPTRTGLQQVLNETFENAGLKKVSFDNVRELIKYDGGELEATGQLKIFDLKTGKLKSFYNSDVSILDISGWKGRVEQTIEQNKKSPIEYLNPTPGSSDQIPTTAVANGSTVYLGGSR